MSAAGPPGGTVCLQGGAEFGPGSLAMDAALVADALRDGAGPVVVAALAGAPGREYATAGASGVRHLRAAGAPDVVAAPDLREDPDGALAALRRARVVVLPGGSPARLLDALTAPVAGSRVADLLARLLADGGTVVGSSAGAMVLGSWTVLPDRRGPHGPAVLPGLGLAPGVLVVPHWSGPRQDWLRAVDAAVPADVVVLGVPEESGVVLRSGMLTATGSAPAVLVRQGRELPRDRALLLHEVVRAPGGGA